MFLKKHPLAEVFGFPIDNCSREATRYRKHRLCPFNNKVPNCTKDKAKHPLGVCSILDGESAVITCPVRFREEWLIAEDAASFFFPQKASWTTLSEVRLHDKQGKSAGNVDVVLVCYDQTGHVIDFGALEVQAVYISGNIRNPFEHYMKKPAQWKLLDWSGKPNYPNPDYLSSSRKRLAPQLIFKGGIFKTWGKKMAVALNRGFFETLPELEEVPAKEADIGWFVYDLARNEKQQRYRLKRHKTVFTKMNESLEKITRSEAGNVEDFISVLQDKIDEKLEGNNPPDTETLNDPF